MFGVFEVRYFGVRSKTNLFWNRTLVFQSFHYLLKLTQLDLTQLESASLSWTQIDSIYIQIINIFFQQARLFDEPQLAALCLETIDKNTPEALGAEGFTDIDINTLGAVLDRDSLRIKEAKLFAGLYTFHTHNSNRDQAIQGEPAKLDIEPCFWMLWQ